MRAYVFPDAALMKQAGRFVWLAIDTEKATNAGFLDKYPIEVWPTLLVVDAAAERAALTWPGSATVAQLEKLLDDGERAARGVAGGEAEAALAQADRLNAERRYPEAAAAYQQALTAGGSGFARRAPAA